MLKFSLQNDLQSLFKNSSKRTKLSSFNLIDQSYNVFEFLPKDFTISTNNGSYKFNTRMLKDTSPKISEILQKNPEKHQYHLNLDDPKNTMSMIEQLYEGKEISLSHNHLLVIKKFSEALKISNFPSFTKLSNLQMNQNFLNLSQVTYNFKLDQTTLISFLQSIDTFFTISIVGKQYQCNIYGVRSSKKINELIEKGIQTFEYDVEDEFDNFQLICDLFNFKNIEITSSNMDSLKRFSEDLQIEFLVGKVDKFINSYENFNQVINDKQNIVDSVENLFELLYNRNKQTVDFVKDSIIKSEWINTEEDVQELAAIFGQVICYNFLQHQFLYDLIISLDQESKNHTNLKLLFPTIVISLMNSFSFNKCNCAFIYKLYKNGFISKEEIIEKFDQFDRTNAVTSEKFNTCLLCFLPEIIESKTFSESYLFEQNHNFHHSKFFKFYYPNKLDEYKKMRDFGKPDSKIAQALINDDIDSLQKAISQINDFTTMKIPFNIFDDYINNGETSLINYAANYGSVSCFKYLLLNHAEIDKYSFQYAVRGGNIEIVHIVDQYYNEKNIDIDLNISNNSIFRLNKNLALDPISPTIFQHQYDLFDWILQEKYINKGQTGNKLEDILIDSSKSGNIHTLIECINNGLDFNSLSTITICQMIGEASFGGFYKYVQIAYSFIQKKIELAKKNIENSILIGNLSIFKFVIQIDPRYCNNFNDPLLIAIKMNYFHIVKYIVENYFQDDIKLTKTGLIKCLHAAIKLKSDVFNYLINKFDFNRISAKYCLLGSDFMQFSNDACLVGNLKNMEILTNLIMSKFPNTNFTYPFVTAAEGHFFEICKFLIDKKVPIDLFTFSKELFKLNSIDEQIFNLLIKDADQEDIDILFGNLMYKAIELHNKKIVEFLFSHDIRYKDALFHAVINKDIEITKIVLKYNKPSFINQLSKNGTALNVAVQNHDFNMVQFLLTVPEINPNLYNKKSNTPLVSAIINADIDIVNLLLDYYGENIQSQLWQINLSLMQILDNNNKDQIERMPCVVKRLLKIQNLDLNCSSTNNTLLTYACEINDLELVKILVKSNKIDVNKYAPINGFTPLMVAIMKKEIEIINYLIELPQTNLNIQNYNSETALFLAVSNEMPDIVTMIMNNDKFDPVESDIDHAFYIANDLIASQLILADGLDVNYREANNEGDKKQSNEGDISYLIADTSLTYAVNKQYISKIKMIVNHLSFNKYKSHVKTAIFMAVHKDQVEIFRILLPFIGNDVNVYLKPNDSLLINSVIYKSVNLINEILAHESFDSEKSDLLTAFHLIFCHKTNKDTIKKTAIFNSMISIYEYDSNNKKLIDFSKLLPNGKSYFTSISDNFTNISDIVNFFLEHGCDPDSPDQTGIYPLEHAIELNSYDFVNLLVETKRIDFNRKFTKTIKEGEFTNQINKHTKSKNKPSNPNIKYTISTRKNLSYLHLAIKCKNPKVFNKLLKLNVIDINMADDQDETPLFYAVKLFKMDIIQKLFLMDNLDYEHKNKKDMDAIKYAQHLFALYSKRNLRVDQDTNTHYETKGDYLTELLSILNLFKQVEQ